MIEHPSITEMNRKGYIGDSIAKREVLGRDYNGDNIYENSVLVVFENGDRVLEKNLKLYLEEQFNASFIQA